LPVGYDKACPTNPSDPYSLCERERSAKPFLMSEIGTPNLLLIALPPHGIVVVIDKRIFAKASDFEVRDAHDRARCRCLNSVARRGICQTEMMSVEESIGRH